MHNIFLRSATLISLSAACVTPAAVRAQTPSRPTAPRAPVSPQAPAVPRAPRTSVAPIRPFEWRTFDGPRWIDLNESTDMAMADARIALDEARDMNLNIDIPSIDLAPLAALRTMYSPRAITMLPEAPRAPWAKDDPADSLYRLARESLNSGEYRRAAQLFAQISRQYPTSKYRADANYWRAFALYRIGGIADLHEALQALDSVTAATAARAAALATSEAATNASAMALSGKLASLRSKTSDSEAAVLAMRIRGALAARGDATAAAQVARTADGSATSCDEEDAQLRVEALNALVQMDPKNADPAISKVLARRDACAAPLRRGALALIARSGDTHATDLLIGAAQNDPDLQVRAEAISWLGRSSDARATTVLTQIATSSDKPPLQRIAVRALAGQESPAARQSIRNLMTRTDVPDDVRITALHYAGKSDLQIADLTKMYDAATDRSTRDEIISLLEQRQEPQAADKLIDIARTSTDPSLRRGAIEALSRKKDPRTTKLLMDILNK